MEWVIHFIAIWTVFILLGGLRWKEFKVNVWCGIFSIVLHLVVDAERIALGLYVIKHQVISVFGSSFFFTFGASFVAGMLVSMLQPRNKWIKVLHVILFTSTFTIEEYLLTKTGAVEYIHWTLLGASLPVNFMAIASISWFSIVVLGRGR